jgi:hypothetical protein
MEKKGYQKLKQEALCHTSHPSEHLLWKRIRICHKTDSRRNECIQHMLTYVIPYQHIEDT